MSHQVVLVVLGLLLTFTICSETQCAEEPQQTWDDIAAGAYSNDAKVRFRSADDFRFFDSRVSPAVEWKYTPHLTALISDSSASVRCRAFIGLSACARYLPKPDARAFYDTLHARVQCDAAPSTLNELALTYLAIYSIATESVVVSPMEADLFERDDFVLIMRIVAAKELEKDKPLEWTFFMMLNQLRHSDNRIRFVPRLVEFAISGQPEHFSSAWNTMVRHSGDDPLTWKAWLSELAGSKSQLVKLRSKFTADLDAAKSIEGQRNEDIAIRLQHALLYLSSLFGHLRDTEQAGATNRLPGASRKPDDN